MSLLPQHNPSEDVLPQQNPSEDVLPQHNPSEDVLPQHNPSEDAEDRKWARTYYVPKSAVFTRSQYATKRRLDQKICYLLWRADRDREADTARLEGLSSKSDKILHMTPPDYWPGHQDDDLPNKSARYIHWLRFKEGPPEFDDDYWTIAFHPGVYTDDQPCSAEHDAIDSKTFVLAADPDKVNVFDDNCRQGREDFDADKETFLETGKPYAVYASNRARHPPSNHLDSCDSDCEDHEDHGVAVDFYVPTAYVVTGRIGPDFFIPHSELPQSMLRASQQSTGRIAISTTGSDAEVDATEAAS